MPASLLDLHIEILDIIVQEAADYSLAAKKLQALTVLSRVCKVFYSLASKHLYARLLLSFNADATVLPLLSRTLLKKPSLAQAVQYLLIRRYEQIDFDGESTRRSTRSRPALKDSLILDLLPLCCGVNLRSVSFDLAPRFSASDLQRLPEAFNKINPIRFDLSPPLKPEITPGAGRTTATKHRISFHYLEGMQVWNRLTRLNLWQCRFEIKEDQLPMKKPEWSLTTLSMVSCEMHSSAFDWFFTSAVEKGDLEVLELSWLVLLDEGEEGTLPRSLATALMKSQDTLTQLVLETYLLLPEGTEEAINKLGQLSDVKLGGLAIMPSLLPQLVFTSRFRRFKISFCPMIEGDLLLSTIRRLVLAAPTLKKLQIMLTFRGASDVLEIPDSARIDWKVPKRDLRRIRGMGNAIGARVFIDWHLDIPGEWEESSASSGADDDDDDEEDDGDALFVPRAGDYEPEQVTSLWPAGLSDAEEDDDWKILKRLT